VLAGSEARLEHVRALVDLGAALRRANRRTEARERLREGADLARKVGALGLAERAYDEIAATGARPRRILQTGLDALTASERRVAQLAADGMTNKEIAQTLFITIKTVEVHLSHAYRKLEISSRTQLDKVLLTPHRADARSCLEAVQKSGTAAACEACERPWKRGARARSRVVMGRSGLCSRLFGAESRTWRNYPPPLHPVLPCEERLGHTV
jgi:DNA-binding CsgD family transcriptional regulator